MADRDNAPKRDDNDSLLKEVSDDLNEERLMTRLRKWGPGLLIGAGAVLIAVSGMQVMNHMRKSANAAAGAEFAEAIAAFNEDENAGGRAAGRAALEAQAREGRGGYRHLAALRLAAAAANNGDYENARQYFSAVATDAPTRRLRNFARIRLAYLALDENPEAVSFLLSEIEGEPGAYGPFVRELQAFAALRAGRLPEAQRVFEAISLDLSAPQPLRSRAEEFAAFARSSQLAAKQASNFENADLAGALGLNAANSAPPLLAAPQDGAGEAATEETPPAEDASEAPAGEAPEADAGAETAPDGETDDGAGR